MSDMKIRIPIITLICAVVAIIISLLIILLMVLMVTVPELSASMTSDAVEGIIYIIFYSISMIISGIAVFFKNYKVPGAVIAVFGFFLIFSFWFFGIFLIPIGIVIFLTKENLAGKISEYFMKNDTATLSELAVMTKKNEAEVELAVTDMIKNGKEINFDPSLRRVNKKKQ
jgi:hypothetical protein